MTENGAFGWPVFAVRTQHPGPRRFRLSRNGFEQHAQAVS